MAAGVGTTWFVNSVAISAVMGMILLANFLVDTIRIRTLVPVYLGLAASLILNFVFPFSLLLALQPVWKAVAAGSLMGLPVFFSGIIFVTIFSRSSEPGLALGSNLMGTIFGGACESVSFITGINALGLVALAFYFCSYWVLRRRGSLISGT